MFQPIDKGVYIDTTSYNFFKFGIINCTPLRPLDEKYIMWSSTTYDGLTGKDGIDILNPELINELIETYQSVNRELREKSLFILQQLMDNQALFYDNELKQFIHLSLVDEIWGFSESSNAKSAEESQHFDIGVNVRLLKPLINVHYNTYSVDN